MNEPIQGATPITPISPVPETAGSARSRRRPPRNARVGTISSLAFLQPLPAWFWYLTAAGVAWAPFTANPLLTACGILMLPLLAGLLWFPGEPPILLFACCIQWMQATMGVFYADFQSLPLDAVPELGSARVTEATWLTTAGVLALAIGMRVALSGRDRNVAQRARSEARSLQTGRVFVLYLITFILSASIGAVAWAIPRITQPLLAFSAIRWVMVFTLAYSVLVSRRGYGPLGFAVALEVLAGFTGFFAQFKQIFYVLLIALAGAGYVLRGWRLVQFFAVAALLLVLAIGWTAIKGDYRDYLNQGTGQQTVEVPVAQRLEKIGQLSSSVNAMKFKLGFDSLLLRISYVEFFALSIQNVPSNIPYQDGALWLGSIEQVIMPRLLFPNKPAISDSTRTSYFTGVRVAGAEQGTSISIGYMGESYIDFGPAGMFAPIFLLGIFYGLIYRLFIGYSRRKVIGLAIAVAILVFGGCELETSNIKIMGGTVVVCIAMALVLKFGEGMLWNYMAQPVVGRARRRLRRDNARQRDNAVQDHKTTGRQDNRITGPQDNRTGQ